MGQVQPFEVAKAKLNTTSPTNGTLEHALQEIEKHLHPVGGEKLCPTGVTPVTITSAETSDTFGDWTEVIPASTISYKYDPHSLYLANVSDSARYYVVELGYGAAESETAVCRVVVGASASNKGVVQFKVQMPRIAANERLSARVKDDEDAENTIDIAVGYHEYPTIP